MNGSRSERAIAEMLSANHDLYDLARDRVGHGNTIQWWAVGIANALGTMAGSADHDGALRTMVIEQFDRAYRAERAAKIAEEGGE